MRVDETNWGWISYSSNMYFKLSGTTCTMLKSAKEGSIGKVFESDSAYEELSSINYFIMPREFFIADG